MSRGAALTGALLITLATPATWPLALAAFLLRGGILVVTLPIVVLPTPVGLGRVFGPTITAIVLGSLPVVAIAIGSAIVGAVFLWLLLGGWLAAALEAEGARIVARDDDLAAIRRAAAPARPGAGGDARVAGRILTARLVAYLPLCSALAWGSVRVVNVTYAELTVPSDVDTSIVLRVVRAAPEVIVAVILAWMVGEIVGALAARRITLRGDPVVPALRAAVVVSIRHPLATLGRFWLPTLALGVVVIPSALAAASAWTAVDAVLRERGDPLSVVLGVVSFVLLWSVGVLLAAVVSAWRAAAWTVGEVIAQGTFGGSPDTRPGHWRSDPSSATL
jgi:hypothetical protein